jgi:hypothetical protein
MLYSLAQDQSTALKNLEMEREEVGPSQLKKRTQDCRALCQNRTLVEEIFVKKTMCTQYNQYFIISHNIFNDAGHFCEISDNFVKRNVQRVRN